MKKNVLKKLVAIALGAAMVVSTVACGSTAPVEETKAETEKETEAEVVVDDVDDETEAAAPAGDGLELSIMWWGSDARHEATCKVLEMYAEKTGVSFPEPDYTGWDGFWQKLPVLAASNSITDVLQMDAAYIHQYIDNGKLVDLSQYIDLSEFMTEDEIATYTINGGVYGLPLSRNGQGIVYDKDRLEELGIEAPKADWTWDEMIDWCYAAKDKCPEGVWPLYDMRGQYATFQEYAQSMGDAKSLDGTKFQMKEETYKNLMNTMAKLQEDGIIPDSDTSIANVELDPLNDNFLNGKVLLRTVSIGSVATLASQLKEGNGHSLGYTVQPMGDGGAGWCQSTIFFAVSTDSAHPQEAADFVKYFVTDVEAGKALGTVRGLPLSDAVYEEIKNNPEVNPATKEFYDVISAVKYVPYWDDVPTVFADFSTAFKQTSEELMLGTMTVDEAWEYLSDMGESLAE